jgi:hypothetical protein
MVGNEDKWRVLLYKKDVSLKTLKTYIFGISWSRLAHHVISVGCA